MEELKSKVAVCRKCENYVLACHKDYLSKEREKEFTEFTNMGFIVKLETIVKTKKREYSYYKDCLKH